MRDPVIPRNQHYRRTGGLKQARHKDANVTRGTKARPNVQTGHVRPPRVQCSSNGLNIGEIAKRGKNDLKSGPLPKPTSARQIIEQWPGKKKPAPSVVIRDHINDVKLAALNGPRTARGRASVGIGAMIKCDTTAQ